MTDIFVANCLTLDARFELFRNNKDLTFTDVSLDAGLNVAHGGGLPGVEINTRIGIAFGDYDLDGDLDILITGSGVLRPIAENNGNDTYTMVGEQIGLGEMGHGWGSSFTDFDNDGYLDVFYVGSYPIDPFNVIGNSGTVYLNNGDKTFSIAVDYGLQDPFPTGVATGDFNNDGFADLLVVTTESRGEGGRPVLLRNRGGDNNWVTVRTIGTDSNRDGIGARVTVRANDMVQVKEVRAGSAFLSSDSPWLTFGLGSREGPVDIEIKWPSGLSEIFSKKLTRQIVSVTEGTGLKK